VAGLGAAAVEVATRDARAARKALAGRPGVESVAQLGARLRVLVAAEVADPVGLVRAALSDAAAHVSRVAPSLEDVFVAATRPGGLHGGGLGDGTGATRGPRS
jgi:ABC-2 type transport system ATP-binding protein